MDGFPSGQRGQTVNLLQIASVVRIHLHPLKKCRSGGTGRRPGLKIPWVVIPVPVRFRSAAVTKKCVDEVPCTFYVFVKIIIYFPHWTEKW